MSQVRRWSRTRSSVSRRRWSKSNVTSLDWVSYPVLRFAEHPDVIPVVVRRFEEPSTGAGEEVTGATAVAIANNDGVKSSIYRAAWADNPSFRRPAFNRRRGLRPAG
jgi:7-keto-8-aminopelargonate synthetase-like enzyme